VRFIAVAGSSPGVGKTTLCRSLARWLAEAGLRVDHFEEEHVLSHPRFARVAAEFTGTGVVDSASFVEATVGYLADAASAGVDVAITDAWVPWIPSLLAFGHTEQSIHAVLDDFTRKIDAVPTLAVYLDGDADTALRRAVAREEPGWLTWFGDKLARYGLVPADPTRTDLLDYLTKQRQTELRALERQPWHLVVVERAHERAPDAVLDIVLGAVTNFLGIATQPRGAATGPS
jgi:thymidylate kinase